MTPNLVYQGRAQTSQQPPLRMESSVVPSTASNLLDVGALKFPARTPFRATIGATLVSPVPGRTCRTMWFALARRRFLSPVGHRQLVDSEFSGAAFHIRI